MLLSLWFLRESNRDGDTEMEAFRGSKSPKKAVDPPSSVKVCLRHSPPLFFFRITNRTNTRLNARINGLLQLKLCHWNRSFLVIHKGMYATSPECGFKWWAKISYYLISSFWPCAKQLWKLAYPLLVARWNVSSATCSACVRACVPFLFDIHA